MRFRVMQWGVGVHGSVSSPIPKVASRMKAGLSDCRAEVVTIPSGQSVDAGLVLVGFALIEQSTMPDKSKRTATERQLSGFAKNSEIVITFTSTYDPVIARNFAEVNSF